MTTTDLASSGFSSEEIARLRQHGIVLFAQRVIFEAQPPMAEADIDAVQAVCSGPIPEQLIDLWRVTAGGSLDYDLSIDMDGNREAIGWCELFYNGSTHYHDLRGWIEHELEIAQEAAEHHSVSWSGKLDALPFGGFEYCDRVYATVESGPSHGHILAWKHGFPPAWTHCLHEDGVAGIGRDLHSAFAALHLSEDPLAPTEEYFAGERLLEYLAGRVEQEGLDRALADKLIAFYRRAVIDWRPKLADGTLAQHRDLALLALKQAIRSDDAALVKQLAAAKVPLHEPVSGSALPIELALTAGAHNASRALIDVGAPVTERCLSDIPATPVSLLESLLAHGAEPAVEAILACAEHRAIDSADLVARACIARDPEFSHVFADAKRRRLAKLQESLDKVRAGKLYHYLTQDQQQQLIDALKAYQLPAAATSR
jgi:hypothetical protein